LVLLGVVQLDGDDATWVFLNFFYFIFSGKGEGRGGEGEVIACHLTFANFYTGLFPVTDH
jgi:hypothetical protein